MTARTVTVSTELHDRLRSEAGPTGSLAALVERLCREALGMGPDPVKRRTKRTAEDRARTRSAPKTRSAAKPEAQVPRVPANPARARGAAPDPTAPPANPLTCDHPRSAKVAKGYGRWCDPTKGGCGVVY